MLNNRLTKEVQCGILGVHQRREVDDMELKKEELREIILCVHAVNYEFNDKKSEFEDDVDMVLGDDVKYHEENSTTKEDLDKEASALMGKLIKEYKEIR